MAKKPPMQVHVTSSDMKSLLEAQRESLSTLRSMEELMKTVKLAELANLVETKKIDDENAKEIDLAKKQLKAQQEQIKATKELAKSFKEAQKSRDEEAEAIKNIATSMTTFKSLGDKLGDMRKGFMDKFGSGSALKTTAMKAFNIGGIFNKSIEREKFIQTQRALGSDKSRGELKEDFAGAQAAAKESKKIEQKIAEFRKLTGLSEEGMKKFGKGRELLDQRAGAAEQYSKFDLRASSLQKTPTSQFASDNSAEEAEIENEKKMDEQNDLLVKIEANTRGASADQKAKPAEEGKGGGLLGNLLGGGKAGKILSGLKDFGVGIVLVAGSLFIAAKAFQEFAEVAWEDVGKGIVALGGLVAAALALDKVKGNVIKGALALGALSLATWGVSEAFKTFSELDWESIGKGFTTIIGLGVVGTVLGMFAPTALLGAAALGALGAAVWVAGKGFQEMNEAFSGFADNLERLAQIDGMNLLKVAAGVAALGPAMALFAAGNVAAGLSNLVTGFLSAVSGQKSPVDQLIEIGKAGEGVEKAGMGMKTLGEAMKAFSGVKKDDLKAINEFPWEKATKFAAAGGAMSANGAQVYNSSKSNADSAAANDSKKSGGGTTVVAPSNTTVNKQTQVVALPVRNQDQTMSRYLRSRFA